MSRHNETVLSHRGQLLHRHIKSFIVLDPKFIACGKIKMGDTVTGHVVFTNKRIISCQGIHMTLMGQSSIPDTLTSHRGHKAYQSLGTNSLIQNGKTQNGISMSLSAIPKGTHKFPFSLLIADSDMMVPSFKFWYAECNYEIQTIVLLKTGSYKASSMPVKISDYMNIRTTMEYSTPIHHWVQGNTSFFNPDGNHNVKLLLESPRSAYSSEEEIPISIELTKICNPSKIKCIQISLVRKDGYTYIRKSEFFQETTIVSKTVKDFTEIVTETLTVPKDLRQSFDFVCIGAIVGRSKVEEVFRVTQSYSIKVTVQPTGFGYEVSDEIPIVIGTDNAPIQLNCLSASQSARSGSQCVWNSSEYGSQLSLPAYSELSMGSFSGRRRRDSQSSIETLPPTFEEAMKFGKENE